MTKLHFFAKKFRQATTTCFNGNFSEEPQLASPSWLNSSNYPGTEPLGISSIGFCLWTSYTYCHPTNSSKYVDKPLKSAMHVAVQYQTLSYPPSHSASPPISQHKIILHANSVHHCWRCTRFNQNDALSVFPVLQGSTNTSVFCLTNLSFVLTTVEPGLRKASRLQEKNSIDCCRGTY